MSFGPKNDRNPRFFDKNRIFMSVLYFNELKITFLNLKSQNRTFLKNIDEQNSPE